MDLNVRDSNTQPEIYMCFDDWKALRRISSSLPLPKGWSNMLEYQSQGSHISSIGQSQRVTLLEGLFVGNLHPSQSCRECFPWVQIKSFDYSGILISLLATPIIDLTWDPWLAGHTISNTFVVTTIRPYELINRWLNIDVI